MSKVLEYNNYIIDFTKYIKIYEKKKRKKMTKPLLAKYILNKFAITTAYIAKINKLHRHYSFDSKDSSFTNSLDSKDNLILIFPKSNVVIFGGEHNMKRISIVNTYYKEDFKEKLFNFTLMDEHGIFCTSSNIAIIDIPLDGIFYTNTEDKEKNLLEILYLL